ncbi:MAG TPA: Clp protease N-terminal domain-containing protein, partial [Longimicrobiales bacterium]
ARAAIDAAIAYATDRRRQEVYGNHLLHALTREEDGPVGRLLSRYGVDVPTMNKRLGNGL